MKTIVVLLATLITSLSFGQAKTVSSSAKSKIEQEILAHESRGHELSRKNDFKGLADFADGSTTDNFTLVHGDGRVEAKTTALKGLRAMAEKKDPDLFYETYKVLEEKVDVYGDAAIYSAKLIERSQGESKAGKTPRTTLFTHFLVKQDGEWKVARAHVAHPPVK